MQSHKIHFFILGLLSHLKGTADVRKPAGAFYLCGFQDVHFQFVSDGLQFAYTLWTILICFPYQVQNIVNSVYRLAAVL